jgi:hypothetical protein
VEPRKGWSDFWLWVSAASVFCDFSGEGKRLSGAALEVYLLDILKVGRVKVREKASWYARRNRQRQDISQLCKKDESDRTKYQVVKQTRTACRTIWKTV